MRQCCSAALGVRVQPWRFTWLAMRDGKKKETRSERVEGRPLCTRITNRPIDRFTHTHTQTQARTHASLCVHMRVQSASMICLYSCYCCCWCNCCQLCLSFKFYCCCCCCCFNKLLPLREHALHLLLNLYCLSLSLSLCLCLYFCFQSDCLFVCVRALAFEAASVIAVYCCL